MSQGDGAALRAAIFQNPRDDRPREVYADWLQERGDRYGHFIAAQLRKDHRAAVADLDAAMANAKFPLFEQLTTVPLLRGSTDHMPLELRAFDRGFLRCAAVLAGSPPSLADHDAWPVVEWFSISAPRADQFVAAVAKRLTSLHSFHAGDGAAVQALAHFRPRVLRELHVARMTQWFELEPVADDITELDLRLFDALRVIRRHPKHLELEVTGARNNGGPIERVLRFVTMKGADVRLTFYDFNTPLLDEVRDVLARLDVEVDELPLVVVG